MLSKVLALSAAVGVAGTPTASALCDILMNATTCNGMAFPTSFVKADCVTAMQNYPVGTDADVTGNSLGCRISWASKAVDASTLNFCRFGGPTGGGICGKPLDNACFSIMQSCPTGSFADAAACATNLTGIAAVFGSNQGFAARDEESLECRVYHSFVGISTAIHCQHVYMPGSSGAWCGGPVPTNNDHYCDITLNACTGANLQYNNKAQCMASVASFPAGNAAGVFFYATPTNVDNSQDCRQYHTNAAVAVGTVHCQHGGPSGGKVCGSTREAWRSMAGVSNCLAAPFTYLKVSVEAAFTAWNATDLLAIVPQDASADTFTVAASGDTDSCRLYHLTVASVDKTHCDHGSILGSNQCGKIETVACHAFQTACGTAAFATQAACETEVLKLLAANKTGVPSTSATATDDLACRMYQVGVALALRKTGPTTAATVATMCGGVKAPCSPICGACTMKSSASTVVASIAAILLPVLFA